MRLLIVWPDAQAAEELQLRMEAAGWEADVVLDGQSALKCEKTYDLWLMHLCLPGLDGYSVGCALKQRQLLCPPRVVLARPSQLCSQIPEWADCAVESGVENALLCQLLQTAGQKPLPKLAAAHQESIAMAVDGFMDTLSVQENLKGRAYASWMLKRVIPSSSPDQLSLGSLYADCARAFGASASSVERCVRVAVEYVFTKGNLQGIERFFGATVDPERGKPTNRAFLMQAAQQLRIQLAQSLTAARSPNSREMHHNPAAPTSV